METRLGKIAFVDLGFGGYQDAMFGLSVRLKGHGWGVDDFKGYWFDEIDEYTKWTEEDRTKHYADVMRFIQKVMRDADVTTLADLRGKPVEVIIENSMLKSWRILTEVI